MVSGDRRNTIWRLAERVMGDLVRHMPLTWPPNSTAGAAPASGSAPVLVSSTLSKIDLRRIRALSGNGNRGLQKTWRYGPTDQSIFAIRAVPVPNASCALEFLLTVVV